MAHTLWQTEPQGHELEKEGLQMRKRLLVGSLAFILLTVGLANWAQYNYYDVTPGARSFFTKTVPTGANGKLVLPEAQPVNILVNDPLKDRPFWNCLTQSTTSMVVAGTKVVAAYNDTTQPLANLFHPWMKTGWSYSSNGGATFMDRDGLLPYSAEDNWGQPSMARDPYLRRIYLATVGGNSGNNIQVYRSLNDGVSFADVVNATPNFTGLNFQDKPSIAVDTFAGTGQGNVYLVWRHFDFLGVNGGIRLTRSTDGGTTWGPSQGIMICPQVFLGNNINGASVVVGRDHSVHVFWWWDNLIFGPTMWYSRSTDRGVTFSAPVGLVYYGTPNNLGDLGLVDSALLPMETNSFPKPAVNRVTGHLYVFYNDWYNDFGDILYLRSTTNGATWSWYTGIAWPGTQWHPEVAVTPDGNRLMVTYYDRFYDVLDDYTNRTGMIAEIDKSTGGFYWGYPFLITSQSWYPLSAGAVLEGWEVPEYRTDWDSAAADTNYFYSTWSDERIYDPYGWWWNSDVRFSKFRVTGPGAVLYTDPYDPAWLNGGAALLAPNGCNTLEVPIYNFGTADAYGVNATLQTSTPGVRIDTPSVSYGDVWYWFGAYYPSVPFQFSTDPAFDLVGNLTIEFVMNVTTANAGVFSWHFSIPTAGAAAGTGECTITPSSQYDMYAYDDYARAAVCVSSSTGAYQWTMLPSGVQYTGTASIIVSNPPFELRLQSAVGDPKRFSFVQSGTPYARATFSYPVAGVASGIVDMNTLDSLWLCP